MFFYFRTMSKAEVKENEKELGRFCEKHHCEMYNIMHQIKNLLLQEKNKYLIAIENVQKRYPKKSREWKALQGAIKKIVHM